MPAGKSLSEEEKTKIATLTECGRNVSEIARLLQRSRRVVQNFLKLGVQYGSVKRSGRKPLITKRLKRQIINEALIKQSVSSEIKANLCLPVTTRRIRQILNESNEVKWLKRWKKPRLTQCHIEARKQFAKKYMTFGDKWETVIFSDEKKFNLDGPDGLQYYWHDLSKEREFRMSRNFGGGSVMVWGAFCATTKLPLARISTKMKSNDYINLLDEILIEFGEDLLERGYLFQQDNAAIHVSATSKNFFTARDITLLDWPACSPDLNPMENLWGIIARQVYKNGRQYTAVNELESAIRKCWKEIPQEKLTELSKSMNKRIFELINKNGNFVGY